MPSALGGSSSARPFAPSSSKPAEDKPDSLWEQATSLIRDAPGGLVSFLGGALTDPGQGALLGSFINPGLGTAIGAGIGTIGAIGERLIYGEDEPWFEESEKMLDSVKRTGGNIMHPSRYLKAIEDGTIVGTLVEDIGNISLIAAPATRAVAAPSRAALRTASTTAAEAGARLTAAEVAEISARNAFAEAATRARGIIDPRAAADWATARRALDDAATAKAAARTAFDAAEATYHKMSFPHRLNVALDRVADAPFTPYRLASRAVRRSVPTVVLGEGRIGTALATAAAGDGLFARAAKATQRIADIEARDVRRAQRTMVGMEANEARANTDRQRNAEVKWFGAADRRLQRARADAGPTGDHRINSEAAMLVMTDRVKFVADAARNLVRLAADEGPAADAARVAFDRIATAQRVTPEALELSLRMLDDADTAPEIAALRDAVAEIRTSWEDQVAPYLTAQYQQAIGERRGERSQAEIDFQQGIDPNPLMLTQVRDSFKRDFERENKARAKAQERATKAQAELDRLGLSSADLRRAGSYQRVIDTVFDKAEQLVDRTDANLQVWERWAASGEPRLETIAEQLIGDSYVSKADITVRVASALSEAYAKPDGQFGALAEHTLSFPEDLPPIAVDLSRLADAERVGALEGYISDAEGRAAELLDARDRLVAAADEARVRGDEQAATIAQRAADDLAAADAKIARIIDRHGDKLILSEKDVVAMLRTALRESEAVRKQLGKAATEGGRARWELILSEAGQIPYVPKDSPMRDLYDALKEALPGKHWRTKSFANRVRTEKQRRQDMLRDELRARKGKEPIQREYGVKSAGLDVWLTQAAAAIGNSEFAADFDPIRTEEWIVEAASGVWRKGDKGRPSDRRWADTPRPDDPALDLIEQVMDNITEEANNGVWAMDTSKGWESQTPQEIFGAVAEGETQVQTLTRLLNEMLDDPPDEGVSPHTFDEARAYAQAAAERDAVIREHGVEQFSRPVDVEAALAKARDGGDVTIRLRHPTSGWGFEVTGYDPATRRYLGDEISPEGDRYETPVTADEIIAAGFGRVHKSTSTASMPGFRSLNPLAKVLYRRMMVEADIAPIRDDAIARNAEIIRRTPDRAAKKEGAAEALGAEAGRTVRRGAKADRTLERRKFDDDGAGGRMGPTARTRWRGRSYAKIAADAADRGRRVALAEQQLRVAAREVGLREKELGRLNARQTQALLNVADNIDAAPAPYRVGLANARLVAAEFNRWADELEEAGADPATIWMLREQVPSLATTLAEAVQREIYPPYVPGGEPMMTDTPGEKQASPGASTSPTRGAEALPTEGSIAHSRQSRGIHFTTNFADLSQVMLNRVQRAAENEMVFRVERSFGRSLRSLVESGEIAPLPIHPGTGRQFTLDELRLGDNRRYLDAYIIDFAQGLRDRQMRVWDPSTRSNRGTLYIDNIRQAFTEVDNPSTNVRSLSTTFAMPDHIVDALHRNQLKPGGELEERMRKYVDRPTRVWKNATLALNPRWQVGNLISNPIMAMVGDGINPLDYARYARWSREFLREGVTVQNLRDAGVPEPIIRAAIDEAHAAGHGIDGEGADAAAPPQALLRRGILDFDLEAQQLKGEHLGRETGGSLKTAWKGPDGKRHPIQFSYEFNGLIDDFNRMVVYLAEMDRGHTPAQIDAIRQGPLAQFYEGMDDAQVVEREAIREALRIQGDFTTMSPIERQVIRRVLPFYPWLRHITKLTMNLAADHPMRIVWMMRLGTLVADEDLEYAYGGVRFGDGMFLDIGGLNPFQSSIDLVTDRDGDLSPTGVLRATNPLLKGVAFAGGYDLGRGNLVSRPGDPFARKPQVNLPVPGLGSASEWWYFLTEQNSWASTGRELLPWAIFGSEPVVRYGQGDTIYRSGEPIPTDQPTGWWSDSAFDGRLDALGPLFKQATGLPTLTAMNVEERKATQERRDAAQQAALERYSVLSGGD